MAPRNHAACVGSYCDAILSGEIIAGRYVELAVRRYLDDLEHAHERGLHFDAASRGVNDLKITEADVTWACEVADYCSRLFQRKGFASIADSEFERNCKSTVESIKRYASHSTGQVSHRLLTSRAPLKRLGRQGRTEVMFYLQETGTVTRSVNQHGGVVYELAETKKARQP
jgi:hypothetical protein